MLDRQREYHTACKPKKRGKGKYSIRRFLPALMEFWDSACAYCGRHLGGMNQPSIDHFYPIAKGASRNGRYNLVLTCRWCNRAKADRMPEDYLGKEKYQNIKERLVEWSPKIPHLRKD